MPHTNEGDNTNVQFAERKAGYKVDAHQLKVSIDIKRSKQNFRKIFVENFKSICVKIFSVTIQKQ